MVTLGYVTVRYSMLCYVYSQCDDYCNHENLSRGSFVSYFRVLETHFFSFFCLHG
jgi:hypothetical protein